LQAAGNEAKVAIMMILTGVNATDSITFLKQNDGFLRAAVESKGAVT
jgi:N-acetylmuramic acid 6-phosphate etherase